MRVGGLLACLLTYARGWRRRGGYGAAARWGRSGSDGGSRSGGRSLDAGGGAGALSRIGELVGRWGVGGLLAGGGCWIAGTRRVGAGEARVRRLVRRLAGLLLRTGLSAGLGGVGGGRVAREGEGLRGGLWRGGGFAGEREALRGGGGIGRRRRGRVRGCGHVGGVALVRFDLFFAEFSVGWAGRQRGQRRRRWDVFLRGGGGCESRKKKDCAKWRTHGHRV